MRKLALALAFLMIIPGAAFGLEMMNDGAMDDVTGQSGVTIAADDVQIFLNIDRMAWLDCDGFTTSDGNLDCEGSGAALGISDFQIDTLQINAILNSYTNTDATDGDDFSQTTGTTNPALLSASCGSLSLNFDYGSTSNFAGCTIDDENQTYEENIVKGTKGLDNWEQAGDLYKPISIDATSRLPALSEGKEANYGYSGGDTLNVGGVLIGLPTMEFYIPSLSFTPALYNLDLADDTNKALNDKDGYTNLAAPADFGKIELSGITFTTLSGWLEIAPH